MRGVRTTLHSTIRKRFQRRRKCAAVNTECSRPQQGAISVYSKSMSVVRTIGTGLTLPGGYS